MRKITTTISLLLIATACADTHEPEPTDDWRLGDGDGDGDGVGDGDGDGDAPDAGVPVVFPELCSAWLDGAYQECAADCPDDPAFPRFACLRTCYTLTHRDLAGCWADLEPSTAISKSKTCGDAAVYHECEAEAFAPCAGCWVTGKADGCTDAESCPTKHAECVDICDVATEVCEW